MLDFMKGMLIGIVISLLIHMVLVSWSGCHQLPVEHIYRKCTIPKRFLLKQCPRVYFLSYWNNKKRIVCKFLACGEPIVYEKINRRWRLKPDLI
jgi:hypothetical protein